MPVIGITGGVASGKTRAMGEFQSHFPEAEWFSADSVVGTLYESDGGLQNALKEIFGVRVLSEGRVNRDWIRESIFRDPQLRSALNSLMHPRVRDLWAQAARKARESKRWFFAEIPLLYETDGQSLCDQVVVVACSVQTQIRRLMSERKLPEDSARRILEAQWPAERKMLLGDFLLWNESPLPCLQRQIALLVPWLLNAYA